VTKATALAGGKPSDKVLSKHYGPFFMWGQLSGWYKQTVYDPTASLSAERRGTLSLPDIETCFGTKKPYAAKERSALFEALEARPEAAWRPIVPWGFRNDAKLYGSPMCDQVRDALLRCCRRAAAQLCAAAVAR